ncbi:hypothetical protein FHX49_001988 [Microbacterium endophyticum]|uniref:Uncharacterized protein n=1 Tax=Microbacterium endophyticum TaxID=1526412 RepID=A0A7W4V559_9MICO|nr:hypothetical protein [Microbacterium endophyticum]MBB2976413.1 hypothetical protein [Microbacterium endophyticum]NIK35859.1 hypothetical protein [Microbacterium endophyticum]
MPRLQADANVDLWVPVTGSFGLRGRRHRKAAIRMLMNQGAGLTGAAPRPGSGFAAWAASQATPLLLRKAAGRILVWVWKAEPEQMVAIAQLQEATPQMRTARAMMPMEYDDTEDFRNPHLGTGEKLAMELPSKPGTPPFATYTWDTGTHFVTLTAVGGDRERFGIVLRGVDDIARTLRIVDDIALQGDPTVLRINPSA